MNTHIFGAYPAFLLFLPPVWLWMLWHFSALAFEMDIMLKKVSAQNEAHIALVQKAWRLFTHLTFAFVLSCALHGGLVIYWAHDGYPHLWLFVIGLPALVFVFFSRMMEPSFCRWRDEVSSPPPP